MEMKLSNVALSILVVALIALLVVTNVMYGKLNETVLIQIVQQQSTETNSLIKKVFENQKDLEAIKKELETTKAELVKALKTNSAVITVTPAPENKNE
ncbi:MAG: hypothetical protein NT014_04815 [Candidatus Omnitrophica bacterium]|nr:hypothetical protein [Candidatus Omnitrophota bacterium]